MFKVSLQITHFAYNFWSSDQNWLKIASIDVKSRALYENDQFWFIWVDFSNQNMKNMIFIYIFSHKIENSLKCIRILSTILCIWDTSIYLHSWNMSQLFEWQSNFRTNWILTHFAYNFWSSDQNWLKISSIDVKSRDLYENDQFCFIWVDFSNQNMKNMILVYIFSYMIK